METEQIIYKEICEARRFQQESINLLNQKHYWIIASNVVVIIGLLTLKEINAISLLISLFFLLALGCSFISIRVRTYKGGPKIKELIEKSKNWLAVETLRKINKKIEKDIDYNRSQILKLKRGTWFSIIPMLLGFIILILFLFLGELLGFKIL